MTMKGTWLGTILLLSFCLLEAQAKPKRSPLFTFTEQSYNITIEENSRGKVFAEPNKKMGVYVPHNQGTVKFKIVQGDESNFFKALSKQVGNFAYLRIRTQPDALTMALNRELKDVYPMLVKATFRQRGKRNLETRAEVFLKILDQNDLVPLFIPSKYDVEISDDRSPMSEIGRVTASDADEGLNGQVYYSMAKPSDTFSVHPVSGSVLLLKKLDARRQSEHELSIRGEDRASRIQTALGNQDSQAASTAIVKIRVKQANLYDPEIRLTKVLETVFRDSQGIQTVALVEIVDRDSGIHGDVGLIQLLFNDFHISSFRIVPSDITGTYRIQSVLGASLPPAGSEYNITLFVEDAGIPPRNATAQMTFLVKNENDTALRFSEKSMQFSVNETVPIGTIVGVAGVLNSVNDVKWKLNVKSDDSVPFEIGAKTGVISVKELLDFESRKSYFFEVEVSSDLASASSTANVTVEILDENNNTPTFANQSTNLLIEINRNTPLESVIGTVTATDADSGMNGKISFQCSTDKSDASPFLVDQWTGDIILRNKITPSDKGWVLWIRAMDWGLPLRRESETSIVIKVSGSGFDPKVEAQPEVHNRHIPKFEKSEYSVQVPEDAEIGSVFASVKAEDKDFGYNGLVQYVLEDNDEGLFEVESYTGSLRVLRSLRDAKLRGNKVTVRAYDCGEPKKSASTSLRVRILDVNDNSPIFDQFRYKISVGEDEKVEKELLRVKATDEDEGINAELSFEFQLSVPEFGIDSKTGVISMLQSLDRERRDKYELVVKAVDGGFPPRSTTAQVVIEVLDINDNPPKCHVKSSKVQVAEDWPEEALVTCLSASDPDSGINGQFSFALDPSQRNLPFRIDSEAGCVRVTKRLNFEERPLYNLTVEVTDQGLPQYSAVCHLLVELVDLNENFYAPVFRGENEEKLFSLEGSIAEKEPAGTEVGSVKAEDPDDLSSPCAYSIVSGNGLGLFTIDSEGIIGTSGILDRETSDSYWLRIMAEDSASVPRSTLIDMYVRVMDKNDHAPRPGKPIYFVSVEEGSPLGTVVTRIEAEDPDDLEGQGAALLYQIVRGDPQSFFTINSDSGYITTHKRKLDRETQETHELKVKITDSGTEPLSTLVLVVIQVSDANDHSPEFQRKIYNFNVPPVQDGDLSSLCRVIASDEDTGKNADLRYNISEDSEFASKFGIRSKTGEIYAKSALKPDESYALTVTVSDQGVPPLSSQARVMLAVLSYPNETAGNGPPVLVSSQELEFHVSDLEQVGKPIGILEAVADGQQLWFDITEGNVEGMFSMRKDTGELQLAMNLKLSNISRYELRYSVSDGINNSDGKVTVHVTHSVELRPRFDQVSYVTEVDESAAVGTVIEQMNAYLETHEANRNDQSIVYFIHEAESPDTLQKLKVEARTGRVVVVSSLDYEACKEHRIVVGARFQNLVNLAAVIIKVKDTNDFEPTFLKSYYETRMYETALIGHPVLNVLAVDQDSGRNGKLTYSVVSGNEQGLWNLDQQSGRITVAKALSLDYPESVLVVKVTDAGDPPFSATTTAQILVIMAEKSVARFAQDTYFFSVSEDQQPGKYLGSVFAESWSGVRYTMDTPRSTKFDLHPASGAIFLKGKLDFETKSYENFTVVARSNSGVEARALVRVAIRDSNDHRPIFDKGLYEGKVSENMPAGTVVLKEDSLKALVVSAKDSDKGSNALVSYQVADSWAKDYFTVDYGTGAVRTKKQLDFETQRFYEFEVLAVDLGSTQVTPVSALVRVMVKDVNDISPKLTPAKISTTLFVPSFEGVFVTQVHAEDKDTVGDLRFAITGDNGGTFEIDSVSGVVRVGKNGAALKDGEYSAPVTVSDGIHSSSGSVEIQVKSLENRGEGALRFINREYHVSVMENVTETESSTSILVLQTEGREIGEHVSHVLLNENTWFAINAISGELTTVGVPIDREETPMKTLVVQARDQRVPPRICQTIVTVTIQDINDCAPMFVNQPYYAVVPLDADVGTNVTVIKATDADEGKNGKVFYRKVSGSKGADYFEVDQHSGIIRIQKKFPGGMKSEDYFIEISAFDGGDPEFESVAGVRIKVVNKAMPVFDQAFYRLEVSENQTVGDALLIVEAKSNVGGTVAYSIIAGDPESQFDVDYLDGILKLKKNLDRETTSRYNLTLRAIDVSRPNVHADAPIVVDVIDSNDQKPTFINRSYRFEVSESFQVGQKIGRVSATDGDVGSNAEITYELEGLDSESFGIDKITGVILLKIPLDFETKSLFGFEAVARDSGFPIALSGSAKIEVRVRDVNDNAPIFSQLEYEAQIFKDAEPGHFVTQISASDQDTVFATGEGNKCIYSVVEGEDSSFFSLDTKTGTVTLSRSLKLIRKTEFTLNVSATDGVFTAHGRVMVKVVPIVIKIDPLRFEKLTFEAAVKENSPRGTTILTLKAKGGGGDLNYHFAGNEPSRPFTLNQESGDMTVLENLDFESQEVYGFSVIVTDESGNKAFAEVKISVVNVNDNAPEFTAIQYRASIRSNTTRGTLVTKVLAQDLDVNDLVEYSIVKDSSEDDIEKHFMLNGRTGELIVRKSLKSLKGQTVNFAVRATDRGNPPLQTEVPIEIYISSPEEPRLKFSERQFAFTVAEDARIDLEFGFGLIAIEQEDLPVKYSVVVGASEKEDLPFTVDDSGVVIVRGQLDREKRQEYLFTVMADLNSGKIGDSKGKIRASVPVTVTVTDVNDNAPIFQSSYDKLEISEDAPIGASLAIISASDADEGQAGQKEFFIESREAGGVFKIDPATGWLILDAPLDREEKEEYKFLVTVRDRGAPPLNSSVQIKVRVTDTNDCAPTFQMESYKFSIGEKSGIGSVIGMIRAIDKDLAPYNNTELFIVGGNDEGHFALKPTGELFVSKKLDYETKKEHYIQLLASDGRFTGKANVKIQVEDENDNAPLCEQEFVSLSLSEDVEVGSGVLTMVADDADSGQFSILNFRAEGSDDFSIDERGILTVAQKLDREVQSSYSVLVKAMDVDGLFCDTYVSITISDVNDSPPTFTKKVYETAVKENLDSGAQFLIRVTAEDPDLGPAGKIQYALLTDKWADLFWMDELTGALTVAKPLDREKRSQYNLTVVAMDQDPVKQLSSTAQIIVRVLDVNDNPPEFTSSRYNAEVSEEEAKGFELVTVKATSLDAKETIRYRLVSPDTALDSFELDSISGLLKLRRQVDYEAQASYLLTVEAEDSGTPPLLSRATINVTVMDANDNAPQFTQSLYQAMVLENSTVGTKVLQVTANDLDSGENGRLSFKFSADNVLVDHFQINEKTGWITVLAPLDRETRSEYRLLVEAWDKGETPLTHRAVAKVVVGDVNDNAPVFSSCNLTATVQENLSRGHIVISLDVTDADGEGNGAPFNYKIVGDGANKLNVEPDGVLVTVAPLIFRDQQTYLLTVEAEDSGKPPKVSECPLTIEVLEESKHPPELVPVSVEINSYLGEFPGGIIARAVATDKDPRDHVTYGLVEENEIQEEIFSMDRIDGFLSSGPAISVGTHRINVSATDGKFTSYAKFEVNVNMITEDALEYAVSMKIKGISAENFVKNHRRKFQKSLARLLSVRPRNVEFLSIQPYRRPERRHRRSEEVKDSELEEIEILFVVKKGNDGFYKPDFVKRKLDGRLRDLSNKLDAEVVSVTTEVCKRGLCVRGRCVERLIMDDVEVVSIFAGDVSFVAPKHKRTFQCICQEGYGGDLCNVAVNPCSKNPCDEWEMCIPLESTVGFECVCPSGKTGEKCEESSCAQGDCESSMSFDGKSYLRYTLSTALDKRLQLAIEIRTTAANGIVMTATGQADYNVLEVKSGFIQYRFDCGSGEGVVRIDEVTVTDGNWHLVTVIRRGRHVKLSLDDKFTAEGYSAGRNAILNLDSNDVYFGAEVHQHPTLYGYEEIRRGFTGCLNRIFVDGFQLPRSKPGMRLYNVNFECSDTFITGVCSSQPCQNFGTCVVEPKGYSCICHPRFTGRNCEMDLNPCASQPCAHGASCENLYNDFFCRCTPGFTGKSCTDVGDFDECISNPCGSNGVCINTKGSFMCNCTVGWTGTQCTKGVGGPPNLEGNEWGITVPEIVGIVVVLMVLLLLTALIILLCRRRASVRYQKAQYLQTVANNEIMLDHPHIRNRLVTGRNFGSGSPGPPPIPPRARGFHPHRNSKLSNLESAQMTGLPTVQVRPLSFTERGESPSLERCDNRWPAEDPGSCPARGADALIARNLEAANNYGSAAEELEQLSRFDLMQTFGKRLVPAETAEQNLRNPDNNGSGKLVRRRVPDDWKAALDLLSLDSIERLKAETKAADSAEQERRRNADMPAESEAGAQSMASIQCLPEEDPAQSDPSTGERDPKSYHWDYSDWNSTLGQPGYAISRNSEIMTDDEDGPLPQGVSALDETDSEYVGDSCVENDDEPPSSSSLVLPEIRSNGGDFKQQLMALQKLTTRAKSSANSSPEKRIGGPLSFQPEDEYVTMKPIGSSYKQYLPIHRTPPDSSRSQRKPLLANANDGDRSESDSDGDSDGADSNQAVVHYGFPKQSAQVAAKLKLHTYDAPADLEPGREPLMSSFRDLSKVTDPMLSSMEGQISQPVSTSDISGVCDIDDSEFPESEMDDPARTEILLSPNSRKQTQV